MRFASLFGSILLFTVLISGCKSSGTTPPEDAGADGDDDSENDGDIGEEGDGGEDSDFEDADENEDADDDGDADSPTFDPIDWGECDDGVDVWHEAQCASPAMPAIHGRDDGSTFDVFVKRVPAQGELQKQLWILPGGPGLSAASFLEPQVAEILGHMSDIEVLVMDYRGTGGSSALECPPHGLMPALDDWPACAEVLEDLGDGLAAYSTSQSAQDLGVLIERARVPEVPVFVYGRNYGTYVLLRYLHFHPHQVDGVILDSLCPPDLEGVSPHWLGPGHDLRFDEVFRQYLRGCSDDPVCSEHLGSDPEHFVEEVLDILEDGRCPIMDAFGLDDLEGRLTFGALFLASDHWPILPSLFYRIHRCSSEDESAIRHYLTRFVPTVSFPSAVSFSRPMSNVLYLTVKYSETAPIEPDWPSQTTVALDVLSTFASRFAGTFDLGGDYWPTYNLDPDVAGWPEETPPLLLLHGELDPQAPPIFARAAEQVFVEEHQQIVMMPNNSHTVLVRSPLAEPGDEHCGLELLTQFLEDPATPLDRSCIDAIPPIDYAGSSVDPHEVYDADSMWGD